MTGDDVKRIRLALRLTANALADLQGVSFTTVYRWERSGNGIIKADPINREILRWLESLASMPGAHRMANNLAKMAVTNRLQAMFELTTILFSIYVHGVTPDEVCITVRGKKLIRVCTPNEVAP